MVYRKVDGGGEKELKTAKSNRDEVRENSIAVPMTKEEKEGVRKAADDMGLSMSAFVRVVLKEFIKDKKG